MDEKDRLLLDLLRRDARRPVVALARDLGLSRTATQERLAKLQSSGAVVRYTIIEGDGSARETAYLLAKLEPGFRCAQIIPKLRSIPTIEAIQSLAGPFDMVVRVGARNIEGIETVRDQLVAITGVAEVTTHIVLGNWIA
jgi:DNA-binding Lrp family transcriptional regulator